MKTTAIDLRRPNRRQALAIGAAACVAPWHIARAARIVKILVGFPPGQATDIIARALAERLAKVTGDTHVVENRPGQGGSLALGQLAKAPADGSVMMLAHMSAIATNPHLYSSVPYDTLRDFRAVGLVADLPFVLVCHPSLPVSNLPELTQYARANPDKLTNASSGNGTVSHLAMEELKRIGGMRIIHVPYQGSARGLTDVLAGNVSMALETAASVMPHVQSGKLRALGAGSRKRLPTLPEIPTLGEQGAPGFSAVTWLMVTYPAGVSAAAVDGCFNVLDKVVAVPDFEQRLLQIGALPRRSTSPRDSESFLRSEYARWGDVVKASGVRLD